MAAPHGNDYGLKLRDREVRQEAFRQYCAHLAKGKSQDNFFFEHPEFTVTYKTLNKYIADNPEEFPPVHLEIAKMKGYQKWEQVVQDSAEGLNEKANTASLQMLMRNKFGWDAKEKEIDLSADKKLAVLGEFFSKIHSQPAPKADKE